MPVVYILMYLTYGVIQGMLIEKHLNAYLPYFYWYVVLAPLVSFCLIILGIFKLFKKE